MAMPSLLTVFILSKEKGKWVVYMCVLMKAGGIAADRKSSPSSLLAPHGPFLWKA